MATAYIEEPRATRYRQRLAELLRRPACRWISFTIGTAPVHRDFFAHTAASIEGLPTGGIPWRFALVSGLVNALLFAVGNRALVYYFEVTQITSAFGATAGFAAIMVWTYWTALTILVGAQIGRSPRDVLTAKHVIEVPEEKI